LWTTEVLERRLGAELPSHWPELRQLANANPIFFHALTLALQLEVTSSVGGRREVIHSLTHDHGAGRSQHCQIQLELATLAVSQGWSARFEERLADKAPPVDVVLRHDGAVVPIEVKVLLMSQQNVDTLNESRAFNEIILRLLHLDVRVTGKFPAIPNERGRAALWSAIEPIAKLVSEDRVARTVEWNGVPLRLSHFLTTDTASLVMPTPLRDDRERLPGKLAPKSIQASRSGARWLRLDIVGGFFQFSPGWDLPLAQRLGLIVEDLTAATVDTDFDGVLLTSGLRGSASSETMTAVHESRAIGLLRQVTPLHGRISVALPLTDDGRAETDHLASFYGLETEWFDRALAKAGLPPVDEIMRRDDE
jgi:hypothetical protein